MELTPFPPPAEALERMVSAATEALDAYAWCQSVTDDADRQAALGVALAACNDALAAAATAVVGVRRERNLAEATA